MFVSLPFLVWISIAAALGVTAAIACLFGNPAERTTLKSAWNWGLAANSAWFAASLMSAFATPGSPLMDQVWLWTAILTLCPPISALGARRPGNRVWNWFIILPMMAVLGWPGLTVLFSSSKVAPIVLQAPACIGFVLVMVMGMGNYLGTRFTLSAILAGLAILLCLLPFTPVFATEGISRQWMRAIAGLSMAFAVAHGIRQGMRPGPDESPFDRIWFDFRDTFGIVWSLRIQDRLNQIAEKDGWSARLGVMGFEWNPRAPSEARSITSAQVEHALRWHLRRFVDPEWIDMRLGASNSPLDS